MRIPISEHMNTMTEKHVMATGPHFCKGKRHNHNVADVHVTTGSPIICKPTRKIITWNRVGKRLFYFLKVPPIPRYDFIRGPTNSGTSYHNVGTFPTIHVTSACLFLAKNVTHGQRQFFGSIVDCLKACLLYTSPSPRD